MIEHHRARTAPGRRDAALTRHAGMRDWLGPAPTNADWIARFAVVAVVLGLGGPDAEPTIVRAIEARTIVERLAPEIRRADLPAPDTTQLGAAFAVAFGT